MKEIILGIISLGAISWLAKRFLFEPIHAQRQLISELIETIVLNSNWIANPGEDDNEKRLEVADKLREYASALESKRANIIFYKFWSKMGLVKNLSSIKDIQDNLIYFSNKPFEESTHPDLRNYIILKNIKKELGIKI